MTTTATAKTTMRSESEIRTRLRKLRREVRDRDDRYPDEVRRLWREDVEDGVAAGKLELIEIDGRVAVPPGWVGPKEDAFQRQHDRTRQIMLAQINALEWVLSVIGKESH